MKAGNDGRYLSSIEKKREAVDMCITIMNGKETEQVLDKILKIMKEDLKMACKYFMLF